MDILANCYYIRSSSILEMGKISSLSGIQSRVFRLALAFFAAFVFIRFVVHQSFKAKHIVDQQIVSHPEKLISLDLLLQRSKDQIFFEMRSAQKIEDILSAKFFVNITWDEELKVSFDHIIRRLDHSLFDENFLSKEINRVLERIKEELTGQNVAKVDFSWSMLFKNKAGIFFEAGGNIKREENINFSSHHARIAPRRLTEYCNSVLIRLGREESPQIDAFQEFI